MTEIAKQDETAGAEILDFMDYARRHAPLPPSADELEEYRRMWPLMLQMLREWEMVKGPRGCPIAQRLTAQD